MKSIIYFIIIGAIVLMTTLSTTTTNAFAECLEDEDCWNGSTNDDRVNHNSNDNDSNDSDNTSIEIENNYSYESSSNDIVIYRTVPNVIIQNYEPFVSNSFEEMDADDLFNGGDHNILDLMD
jgi:hypothetical protein